MEGEASSTQSFGREGGPSAAEEEQNSPGGKPRNRQGALKGRTENTVPGVAASPDWGGDGGRAAADLVLPAACSDLSKVVPPSPFNQEDQEDIGQTL